VPAISGITAVEFAAADSLLSAMRQTLSLCQQQTCCSVLMFRSWPEPLLQQQSFLGAAASTVRKGANLHGKVLSLQISPCQTRAV